MSRKKQEEFDFEDGKSGSRRKRGKTAPPENPETPPAPSGHAPLKSLMDENFLKYASYVICERAIPNLVDGLKPVQRRILHALHNMDDGRFIKVANVVGHTMQYHPHGDAAIGDALVALVNRGGLIEGQGNFGNLLTGDQAAAARYIECRLTDLARHEVLNKDLTDFVSTYDGRNREPVTLPSKIPLLLMLGAEGIAVGLSTRILPHNLRELLEAQVAILQKKAFKILPDFPQGGLADVSGLTRGNGVVRVRAKIDPGRPGTLVIRELPFGTTTEALIASIEDAVRRKKVPVKSITDFTSEKVEIELAMQAGADPNKAMQALYAFTSCETSVAARMVVIHGRRPVETDVDAVLRENTRQLTDILKRELHLRRHRLQEAFHEKTLVQIFVENRIYKRIESCKTYPAVQKAVLDGLAPFRNRFKREITLADVEMLLGVRIRRISQFDIAKNRKDVEAILKDLAQVEKNLRGLSAYAVRYVRGLLKQYASDCPRRTRITSFKEVKVRELTATELQVNYDEETGYLGYDIPGPGMLSCSSYDRLILIWQDGRYRVIRPPDKLFVDKTLLYCAKTDRDRVLTTIYTHEGLTYIKRFKIGGTILNKDYACAPADSRILFLEEGTPERIYVKYRPSKRQRIHQQVFHPGRSPVKGVKAMGNHMTAKSIARLSVEKPRWWNENDSGPEGVML